MSRQLTLKVLGALSLALLAAVPLLAQTQFASFTGTIHSKDGNPVPNVEVAATNVATQVKYTARSNNDGIYTITALPIGTYKIRAESQGFQAYETNPIRLEIGPERARRHPDAARRLGERRGRRGDPHPADPGRGGRARSSRKAPSRASRSTDATSPSCRCCFPASSPGTPTASPSPRTSAAGGRWSTASVSRRTTTSWTAST